MYESEITHAKAGDTIKAYGNEWEILDIYYNGRVLCLSKNLLHHNGVAPACVFSFSTEKKEDINMLRGIDSLSWDIEILNNRITKLEEMIQKLYKKE